MAGFIAATEAVRSMAEKKIAAGNGYGVRDFRNVEIRDVENSGFEKGDIFQIDASAKFFRKFNGTKVPLILVNMADGTLRECYISAFNRNVAKYVPAEDPGLPPVRDDSEAARAEGKAKGTVVEYWKRHANAEDAINGMDKRFVRVSDRREVLTWIRRTKEDQIRPVYDFDFLTDEEVAKLLGTQEAAPEAAPEVAPAADPVAAAEAPATDPVDEE